MYSLVLMAAMTTGPATPACHRSCSGCYGGCYSSCSCYGGWYGCHGCHGCYGGYSWYSCYGCHGCHGGWAYGCYSAWGCHGCYSSYGYTYDAVPVMPSVIEGERPGKTDRRERKSEGGELPAPRPKAEESVRASLTVELPADAKLYVDGQAMKSTSARRRFVTPPLVPGQIYFYDLRAEVLRDGRTVSVSRRIQVQPGQSLNTAFTEFPGNGTATVQAR